MSQYSKQIPKFMMQQKPKTDAVRKAMILAAGKGTRLRPLTDTMPKALVEVGGKTLILRQMLDLKAAGFTDITVNVHHFANMLCDYIAANTPEGLEIHISSERDRLLNTGGALKKAAPALLAGGYQMPVLIHNVDILSNTDMSQFYAEAATHDAALLVSKRNSNRQLYFDPQTMRLKGWQNLTTGETRSPYPDFNPDECENYAFSGIHAVSPRALQAMDSWPEEFSIIDFYLDECMRLDIFGIVSHDLKLLDVGKLNTLHEADEFARTL